MNRKLKLLVLISVLLNVLLLGVVGGRALHHLRGPEMPPSMEQAIASLPQDKQAEFRQTMEALRLQQEAVREEVRRLREETLNVIKAERFDEEAYQQRMTRIQELKALQYQRMADATKDLARHWSKEERAALAQALRRPPRPREGAPK